MAVTSCAHCRGHAFEVQEAKKLAGSHQQLLFVQCAGCGTPVGVIDATTGTRRMEQDARMRKLEQQIEAMSREVHHIGRIVSGLVNQTTY